MASSVTMLLGGRYKLSGELARGALVERGWDRWLDRRVFIKIFDSAKIDGFAAKRQFIDSAQALIRIEHPNVEALLDFGATDAGAPYHVMREAGVDLATVSQTEGRMAWARVRGIVLDVIAGVAALHRRRIVHGDISLHTIALFGDSARLVEFGEARLCEHELGDEQRCVDVRGVAALALRMLTGVEPIGRSAMTLDATLMRAEVPSVVRAVLLRALTEPESVALTSLRRRLAGESRRAGERARARLINAGAAVAAAAMLTIGLWSSVASSQRSASEPSLAVRAAPTELVREHAGVETQLRAIEAPAPSLAQPSEAELDSMVDELESLDVEPIATQQDFAFAHAQLEVGSEGQRKPVTVHSRRFDLRRDLHHEIRGEIHGELSPASLVERGIDLTHGRPTPDDDPRLPIVDGPARARALFEAACDRDYGKGCHMLGVQIAEGMMPDDGVGPAAHYRRGCALDYHRSCAALADLARAGEIVADADSLDAKACRLAGAGSSYCRPRT